MENIKRRETMRAEMIPDVYFGENCDEHEPRWMGSADGDMDGDSEVGIGGNIMLSAAVFPPGTTVTVCEPECPVCGTIPHLMSNHPDQQVWSCECEFDWRMWAEELFS